MGEVDTPDAPAPARIAPTPEPPYTAVIFTSVHSGNADGYARMAARMFRLAAEQPGYLGHESVSEPAAGITVSYWSDHDSASAWKQVAEHLVAQQRGQDVWYADYTVRVATVERAYTRADSVTSDTDVGGAPRV
jgi:heme-degrading monooxygenase HmoA